VISSSRAKAASKDFLDMTVRIGGWSAGVVLLIENSFLPVILTGL
jgi:hypothetical protein